MAWSTGVIPTIVVHDVQDFDPAGMQIHIRATGGVNNDLAALAKRFIGGPGTIVFEIDGNNEQWPFEVSTFLDPQHYSVVKLIEELNENIEKMGRERLSVKAPELIPYLPRFQRIAYGIEMVHKREKPESLNARNLAIMIDPNLACALLAFNFDFAGVKKHWWAFREAISIGENKYQAGIYSWPSFLAYAKHPVCLPEGGQLNGVFYDQDYVQTVSESDLKSINPDLPWTDQLGELLRKVLFKKLIDENVIAELGIQKKIGRFGFTARLAAGWNGLRLDISPRIMSLFEWGGPTEISLTQEGGHLEYLPIHSPLGLYKTVEPPYEWAIRADDKLALHVAGPQPFAKREKLSLEFTYNTLNQPQLIAEITHPACSGEVMFCETPVANFVLPNDFSYDLSTLSFQMEARMQNENGLSMKAADPHQVTSTAQMQIIRDVKITLGDHVIEDSDGLRPVRERLQSLLYRPDRINFPIKTNGFKESQKVTWEHNLFRYNDAPQNHLLLTKEPIKVIVTLQPPQAYMKAIEGRETPRRFLKIKKPQLKVERAAWTPSMIESAKPALTRHTPTYAFTRRHMIERELEKGSNRYLSTLFDGSKNIKRIVVALQSTRHPVNYSLKFERCGVVSMALKQNNVDFDDPIYIGKYDDAFDQLSDRINKVRVASGLAKVKVFSETMMPFVFDNKVGQNDKPVTFEIIFNHRLEENVRLLAMVECEVTLTLGSDHRVRKFNSRKRRQTPSLNKVKGNTNSYGEGEASNSKRARMDV